MRDLRPALALLTTLLLLTPLGLLWWPEVDSGGLSPLAWSALGASVAVAVAAALLAVAAGAALAALFSLTDFPLAGWWATCSLLPFVCPPTVWALGQVVCYGPGGLAELQWGDGWRPALNWLNRGHYLSTALVLGQIHAPVAMLLVGRGMERLHWGGFEAACFYLSPARRVGWLARALRGELAGAFLLVFALSLGNFAVPHVLQCRLYVIDVYMRMTNYLDPAGAVQAATPLLLVALLAAGLAACAEPRGQRSAAETQRRWRISLGGRAWLAGGVLAVYLVLTTLLPLTALVRECGSMEKFLSATRDAAPETQNSLLIGLAASFSAGVAGLLVAGSVRGRRWRLDILTTALLGVPALLTGLAVSRLIHRDGPVDLASLASTNLLVIAGLGLRGWPFAARLIADGRSRLSPVWLEAAEMGGVRGWRRWWWLEGPLLWRHGAGAVVLAFVLAMGEVEISQMLCAPGGGTLALRLFTFLHFGPVHVAASLATLQLILAVAPVLVYFLVAWAE